MQLYDLHVHSRYSQDAKDYSILAACETAKHRGLSGLASTDHFDACYAPIGFPFYMEGEARRQADFAEAKRVYGQDLEILWGVEIGHPYLLPEISREFLSTRTFDFVLGSVHFLRDGRDIYEIKCETEEDADELFYAYFDQMLELLDFGMFDSLAHLDYPLRVLKGVLNPPSVKRYITQIEPVLEKMVKKGVALEINTRGLQDYKRRQEPEDWVLRMFYDLGGRRITLGSDAHRLDRIGVGLAEASEKLREIGFSHMTVYRGREPYAVSLR